MCDDAHASCVAPDQLTACDELVDGVQCTSSVRPGICDQSVCIAGCSDGVEDGGEECDDGNTVDHDGCSAMCRVEKPTWVEWQNAWTPRSGHAAAYDSDRKKLVVFGGVIASGVTDDLWERDTSGSWTKSTVTGPPPRQAAAMAYDAARKRIVLFGGTTGSPTDLLGDTWEYDGTSWYAMSPTQSPTPRAYTAMVFDPVRSRVVLFGGLDGGDPAKYFLQDDTWEYDGTTWTKLATTGAIPPRRLHGMAWDGARNRVVVVSGIVPGPGTTSSSQDTWELTNPGTGWVWTCTAGASPCPTVTHPSSRYAVSLAFSPVNNSMVLFGGLTAVSGFTQNASDTWFYSGTGWVVQSPAISPSGRSASVLVDSEVYDTASNLVHRPVLVAGSTDAGAIDDVWELPVPGTPTPTAPWLHSLTPGTAPARGDVGMVYDAAHARVLKMGGYLPPLTRGDVYSFDGRLWHRESFLPQGRFAASTTYDTTRNRTVLFGGLYQSSLRQNDTYIWDGVAATWTTLVASTPPGKRYGAAIAHDDALGVSVMFGGNDAMGLDLGETWELDATGWTRNDTAGGPIPERAPAMAYDPEHERLVLFDVTGGTWTYTNRAWTPLMTTASPPPRQNARMTFNPARHCIVLYGGTSTEFLDDMWELVEQDGVATWQEVVYANGPPIRSDPGFAPFGDQLVLHGGTSSSGDKLNDTWLFQYRALE